MGIKDLNHISTKRGDKGSSSNYSRETFGKEHIVFETLGTMDELSAFLGLTYHHTKYEHIKGIQKTLQAINALIATNPNSEPYHTLRRINEQDIDFIEREEEKLLKVKDIEAKFHLPGSDTTKANAYFDYARTLARRAERIMIKFIRETKREDLAHVQAYMNRLSDLLFLLARNFN